MFDLEWDLKGSGTALKLLSNLFLLGSGVLRLLTVAAVTLRDRR